MKYGVAIFLQDCSFFSIRKKKREASAYNLLIRKTTKFFFWLAVILPLLHGNRNRIGCIDVAAINRQRFFLALRRRAVAPPKNHEVDHFRWHHHRVIFSRWSLGAAFSCGAFISRRLRARALVQKKWDSSG